MVDRLLEAMGGRSEKPCNHPTEQECRHGKTVCHVVRVWPAPVWCHGAVILNQADIRRRLDRIEEWREGRDK